MMKKKLFVLLTVVCILALATACGSQTSGTDTDSNAGTQSGAQQEESTLTGKLDEKKDFMFVVTDDQGASYQFSIDSSAKPEGYDDVAVGDSVTVTYTGALSEVDPFEGTIASVEKVKCHSPLKITKSRNRSQNGSDFCFLPPFAWQIFRCSPSDTTFQFRLGSFR